MTNPIPIEMRRLYVECRDIQPLAEQYKITPLCDALQEMTAGALEWKFKNFHASSVPGEQCLFCGLRGEIDPGHKRTPADWRAEADKLLRDLEVGEDV
ncbi:MAG TPA: hypothetical protein VIH42_07760 [Thermoguttaceae bacterium]